MLAAGCGTIYHLAAGDHAKSGNRKRNVGVYRMQVYDERTTGMHWQTQKHGAEHFRRARAANAQGRIDVAVAIGSDPMTCLAAFCDSPGSG